jgi:hypothetical protein
MEYQSALMLILAIWPAGFLWGIIILMNREAIRQRQGQLNDALRTLQFVAMQKRGRLWK